MNVDNNNTYPIEAFSPGYNAWLVSQNPNSKWWKEINFQTGFLLSRLLHDKKTPRPLELQKIIDETQMPVSNFQIESNVVFIGTQNHFPNHWLCVIDESTKWSEEHLIENLKRLKCSSVRVFAPLKVTPSLKSSFPNIDFVSDSQ